MKPPESVELVELQGNEPVLVRLSPPIGRQVMVMSRKTGKLRSVTGGIPGQWCEWLAEDDYLLLSCEESDLEDRLRTRAALRFFVCEGKVLAYGVACLLPQEPARSPGAPLAAPSLAQLLTSGRVKGELRVVTRWIAATAAVCVAIRHEQWHGGWLFFKGGSLSVGLCLPDGAYEARAALLDEQDGLCSAWSDVCSFSIAEGRLCVAGVMAADAAADNLSLRPTWTARAALRSASLHQVREGKQLVRLEWTWSGSTSTGFIVSWLATDEFRWRVMTCSESGCDLDLGPGTYRIRLAACDLASLQRSPILAEAVLEVSAAEVRLKAADTPGCMDRRQDREIDEQALDEIGKAAIREFRDWELAPLSESLFADAAARTLTVNAAELVETGTSREVIEELVLTAADSDRLSAMGEAFATVGRLEDARQVFEAYRRQFRQDSTGPGWLGHVAEQEGSLRQALDLYSAASLFPGQANWLYHALRMHLALGDDSAEHYARKVLDLMASEGWARAALVVLAALRGETLSGPLLSALFEASRLEDATPGGATTGLSEGENAAVDHVRPVGSQSLVSVVLPLSQHTDALPLSAFSEPLLSIANQSHSNIEIVLCAPTARVASQFFDMFSSVAPRMRICERVENWTGACLGIAKGEYLTVLDPRVVSHRERFAKQLESMEERSAASACYGLSTDDRGSPLLPAIGPISLLRESLVVRRSAWEDHLVGRVDDVSYCESILGKLAPEAVATVPLPLCIVRAARSGPAAG